MACQNCPEEILYDKPKDAVGWVVYTGGPPQLHLAMMQKTLPKDFSRAKFLPDGSILYVKGPSDWEPPSAIEGYRRDAENPWLFHPLWKSCQLRMYGAIVKESCRCIQVLAVCNHPKIEPDAHGEVTFAMCEACQRRVPIPEPIVPLARAVPHEV